MKYLAIILCVLSLQVSAARYTWNSATTNIFINNSTFGTLHAGDTVYIPARSGGYRSYYIQNLNSGDIGAYIYIIWDTGAYITPASSSITANGIESCTGVYTYGMKMSDHVDAAMRLIGTSFSSWIVWDSCYYRGMPGFGPVQASSVPSFNGDSARTWHHWTFKHCVWDSLYGSTDGGLSLAIGGTAAGQASATVGWWRDVTVDSCWFGHYSSNTVASGFIRLLTAANVTIKNSHFEWLGMVPTPTGHAAQISSIGSKYTLLNNTHGPFNFGNEIRDLGPVDFPMWGPAYSGRSMIAGVLITNKRKYPAFEFQDINSGILSTISAYVQPRASAQVYNVTAYNLATDNGSYLTAIVDMYKTDSLSVKNCIVVGVRNGTWGGSTQFGIGSAGFGPFIAHINTTVSFYDTASERQVQDWSNAGFIDSVYFRPAKGGTLYGQGVAVPAFYTKDIYGSPRTTSTGVDIGAVQLFFSTCNCITTKIKIQPH